MDRQFDILCRLQTLEGMLGVHPGRWSHRLDLTKARAFVTDRGLTLHPEWLSDTDTGFYRQSWKRLARAMKCELDADEIMQNLLAGVSSVSSDLPLAFVVAGRNGAQDIMDGKGTRWVMCHHLSILLMNRSRDVLRKKSREEPLDPEWDAIDDQEPEMALASEQFLDKDNRLRIWEALVGYKRTSAAFQLWLTTWEVTGQSLKLKEIADQLGVSQQVTGFQFKQTVNYLAPIIVPEWSGANHSSRG
jgi:hypothetical protein